MAFGQPEIAGFYQGAILNYIFKFAFESRNPGMEFDADSWVKDLIEVSNANSNGLNIMNQAAWESINQLVHSLDNYKKPINSTTSSDNDFKVI